VAVAVGDATGKGLDAATYTAELKFALRAFLRQHGCPAKALEQLNAFVAENERLDPRQLGQSYTAVALSVIDTDTGELATSLAGAEPPILLSEGGETVELEIGGPLLGVVADFPYPRQSHRMRPGDVLLLSTDGLVEARDRPTNTFFGSAGIVGAVREELRRSGALAEAGKAAIERASAFAGGAIQDDVCLLLARRIMGS
jgi:serine phosphatase RsbU (regulator of sigma subunit)